MILPEAVYETQPSSYEVGEYRMLEKLLEISFE